MGRLGDVAKIHNKAIKWTSFSLFVLWYRYATTNQTTPKPQLMAALCVPKDQLINIRVQVMNKAVAVYVIANLKITDDLEFSKYTEAFLPVIELFGGSVVTYDDDSLTFEGASPREGRMVILQFPSEKLAKDWYASNEYQAISENRRSGSKLEFLTMVRGLV